MKYQDTKIEIKVLDVVIFACNSESCSGRSRKGLVTIIGGNRFFSTLCLTCKETRNIYPAPGVRFVERGRIGPLDTTTREYTDRVLSEFKEKVRAVARRYAENYGWCDKVDAALKEIGIEPIEPKRRYRIEIDLAAPYGEHAGVLRTIFKELEHRPGITVTNTVDLDDDEGESSNSM